MAAFPAIEDNMIFRLLKTDDYRSMPWKNGLGVTCQIIRHPAEENVPFHWRVSMAEVSENGPFSTFPGYRRLINTLEGEGLRLTVDGRKSGPLTQYQPFVFEGESPVESELLAGPIRDFNLIYRRDLCRVRFQWLKLDEPQVLFTQAAHIILFSVRGFKAATDQATMTVEHHQPLEIDNDSLDMIKLGLRGAQTEPISYCCLMEINNLLQSLKWMAEED